MAKPKPSRAAKAHEKKAARQREAGSGEPVSRRARAASRHADKAAEPPRKKTKTERRKKAAAAQRGGKNASAKSSSESGQQEPSASPRVSQLFPAVFTRRFARLVWGLAACLLLILALVPYGNAFTRTAGVACALYLLLAAPGLLWRVALLRWLLLLGYGVAILFLLLPGWRDYDRLALRDEIGREFARYEGVPHVPGGENWLGMDATGLIRRGSIDATLRHGLRTWNPLLVRQAARLWWAERDGPALVQGAGGAAWRLINGRAIVDIPPNVLHPGDFALTRDGEYALAYVGGGVWMQADPGTRVVRLKTHGRDRTTNPWLEEPVCLLRWRFLELPQPRTGR